MRYAAKFATLMMIVLLFGVGTPLHAQRTPTTTCPSQSASLTIAASAVGQELELLNRQLSAFMQQCPNVRVAALQTPDLATDRLRLYRQFLSARNGSVDIYLLDVTWQALLADEMIDLYDVLPRGADTVEQHIPALIANNTVNGKLVSLPWSLDAGLLYYRQDLLDKYNLSVPRTWDALTAAAATIQAGERADGNSEFWGYVWQGSIGEPLLINALEWQASEGGGNIISPNGEVQVNNAPMLRAITRAADWIGEISPEDVLFFNPEDTRRVWQNGDAAFMRNWSYAFALSTASGSSIGGDVGVTVLPAGAGGNAATVSGWGLGVSRYSANPQAAVALAAFLTAPEQQRARAEQLGYNPTIASLYAPLASTSPTFEALNTLVSRGGLVLRPATLSGQNYANVSTLYSQQIHAVLRGERDAETALEDLAFDLEDLMFSMGF